ncbi:MAG: TetR/AcrR family transcriptional regulator [bacterium]
MITLSSRNLALEQAMQTFWEKGYEGASVQVLVDRTGLHRANLYAVFQSKGALFLEALNCYCEKRIDQVSASLSREDPMEALREMATSLVEPPANNQPSICLVLRTTLGQGFEVPGVRERIQKHNERMLAAFEDAIVRAQIRGELEKRDPSLMAQLFLLGLKGLCGARICDATPERRTAVVNALLASIG